MGHYVSLQDVHKNRNLFVPNVSPNFKLKLRTKIFRLNINTDNWFTKPGTMLEIVVVAYNEKHARKLCGIHAGIEGFAVWEDRQKTDCHEIGKPLSGFHYPQVLARYVQTPYKENMIYTPSSGSIESVCEL